MAGTLSHLRPLGTRVTMLKVESELPCGTSRLQLALSMTTLALALPQYLTLFGTELDLILHFKTFITILIPAILNLHGHSISRHHRIQLSIPLLLNSRPLHAHQILSVCSLVVLEQLDVRSVRYL